MALVNMNFGSGTVINKYWTDFKTVVAAKSLSIQYEQDSNQYIIYALDNNIEYTCFIYKGTVPDPSNYSQVTNDADKTDWNNNFQSAAGTKTQLTSNVVVTSALPTGANTIGAVTISGTPTVTANIGTTNGLALDATVSTMSGKLPATIGQKAMAASLPVVLASDQSSIPVTGSGSFTVAQATASNLNATVVGGNTAGTASSAVITIQGNASGIAVPVSGTVTATVTGVSTAANQTSGSQLTQISNGTTAVAIKAASTSAVVADPALVVQISPNTPAFPVTITQTDRTASGTITTTQSVSINSQGISTVNVAVTGTWAGTLVFQASVDGTNFISVNAILITTGASFATTTVNGTFQINCAGYQLVRIIGGSVTSGTASIAIDGSVGVQSVSLDNPLPTGSNVIGGVTGSGNFTVVQATAANLNATVTGTVTSNIGTTNGLALDATVTTLSGKFGSLGQKAMAGSAPVVISSDQSAIPVSGTVTANLGTIAGVATAANQTNGSQLTAIGNGTSTAAIKAASTAAAATDPALVVAISPNNSVSITSSDILATGSITNTQSVAVNSQGKSTVGIALTGTWTGTVVFEKSIDGTNWVTAYVASPQTGLIVTSATTNGTFEFGSAGYQQFRVRGSTVATGSLTVSLNASNGVGDIAITSPLPTGSNVIGAVTGSGSFTVAQATAANLNATVVGTVTANVGTTNGLALDATLTGGTQTTRITDGANTATVKAASTAAVAADKAVVVAISPNNTVATTQSGSWTNTVTQATASNLNATVVGGNTAGTASAAVITIQGNASGIAVPVSGTVTSNIGTTNGLALDATISTMSGKLPASVGQKTMAASLPVVLASDQTAITVAQATAANLNATVVGTVTANLGTIAGVATAANQTNGTQLAAIGNGTNTVAIKAASTAAVVGDPSLVVQISPNQTSIPVTISQTDRTASGAITNTQSVSINSQGCATVNAAVTGAWTGTLLFEGSVDGTNFVAINATINTTGVIATSTTVIGTFQISAAGYQLVRVRGLTVATGSAAIALDAAVGIQSVSLDAPLPTGSNTIGAVTGSGNFTVVQATAANLNATVTGTVTSNIGTTNGLALDATLTGGTQQSRITDGTNFATVKAASTAAVAADKALVVAVSPNNTIAVTQATASNLNATVVGGNTAGTASAAVITIQGNASGIAVPVSGTVTANIGTTNGLALDTTVSTMSGKLPASVGQKTMAASLPVVLASDQSAITVAQSTAANLLATVSQGGSWSNKIWDGTNTAAVKAASTAATTSDPALVVTMSPNAYPIMTQYTELASFVCVIPSVVPGNNKSMMSLYNGSTKLLRISDIYLSNASTSAVTGLYAVFQLHFGTSHATGSGIDVTSTIVSMDTNDTIDPAITIKSGATVTGTSANAIKRTIINSGNWSTTLNGNAMNHVMENYFPLINKPDSMTKPIYIRNNQLITLDFNSNSSVGLFDVTIIFTQQ